MKPGDVVRYHGHGSFAPYFNELIEGDVVVITDMLYHHTGKELFFAVNSKRKGGIITPESLTPTIMSRESLSWAPKFIVGEYVYIKPHENEDYNDELDILYNKPCKITDMYSDEYGFVYYVGEEEQVPVFEHHLIHEKSYDPEITPEDLGMIWI